MKCVDDGTLLTWEDGQNYCRNQLNSDLATIVNEVDLNDALPFIGDETAYIGLRSTHAAGFFEFVDGTECPTEHNGRYSGVCADGSIWEEGHPRKCTDGGQMCVNLSGENGKINNDIHCDAGIKCILCNCENSANGPWTKPFSKPYTPY